MDSRTSLLAPPLGEGSLSSLSLSLTAPACATGKEQGSETSAHHSVRTLPQSHLGIFSFSSLPWLYHLSPLMPAPISVSSFPDFCSGQKGLSYPRGAARQEHLGPTSLWLGGSPQGPAEWCSTANPTARSRESHGNSLMSPFPGSELPTEFRRSIDKLKKLNKNKHWRFLQKQLETRKGEQGQERMQLMLRRSHGDFPGLGGPKSKWKWIRSMHMGGCMGMRARCPKETASPS